FTTTPEDWSTQQSARLQQVIARAFERAVQALDVPAACIELVPVMESQAASSDTQQVQQAQPRDDVKEQVDALRVRDGAYYQVPSYDSGGNPVHLPMNTRVSTPEDTPVSTPSGGKPVYLPMNTRVSTPVDLPLDNVGESTVISAAGDHIYTGEFPRIAVIAGR